MTRAIAGYISFLVFFGCVDAVWLSVMAPRLYLPTLGDAALASVRIIPAVLFYLIYSAGAVFFASARAADASTAFLFGMLFGAVAYATYDLTNYATLKNWSLTLTVADSVYGALATGVAAAFAFLIMRQFAQS